MPIFTKQRQERIAKIVADLKVTKTELMAEYAKLEQAISDFNNAVDTYNTDAWDANDFLEEIIGEIEEYIEGRSDKWKESETGGQWDAWLSEIRNLQLEELEMTNEV